MPIEELLEFQGTLKRLSLDNARKLRKAILRQGFSAPVFVWRDGEANRILDGHQRLRVLKSLAAEGYEIPPLPVAFVEATDEQEARRKLLSISSQYGDIDPRGLDEFLSAGGLDLGDVLGEIRLTQHDLVLEVDAGETIDDDVVPTEVAALTNAGDLWELGQHRLLCGDVAIASHVDRLLGGAGIHLVFTDPPYNANVEPRSKNAIVAARDHRGTHQQLDAARHSGPVRATSTELRARDRKLTNDDLPAAEFDDLLRAWFGAIAGVLEPGRSFYIWGGYYNCGTFPSALKDVGLYFSQAIIWVKEHPVLTRKDFMGNHEWCFHGWVPTSADFDLQHEWAAYGWKKGAAHWFNPDVRNAQDVWSVKKVSPQKMVHLTEKPVELAERALHYSSRPGENVADFFAGSGSTLIAAEKLRRQAYLTEIDPLYCDVIVQRYIDWCTANDRQPAVHRNGELWEGQAS